jgi:cytidylate kinase
MKTLTEVVSAYPTCGCTGVSDNVWMRCRPAGDEPAFSFHGLQSGMTRSNQWGNETGMRRLTIAIDGPASAGKSTVAKALAERLGLCYVDTGAMYRGVAWLALKHGVRVEDEEAVLQLLERHPLQFKRNDAGSIDVCFNGRSIASELRSPEVSEVVSILSALPGVRRLLTEWQREFSRQYSVVMDGRDIGTVVLPDADVKVFLTADLRERAERRRREFLERGYEVSPEELEAALRERDERDATREIAPLKPAPDAICIDSTGKTVSQVVEEILSHVKRVTDIASC